ncbi:MAG: polysaccharide pyruvyl transferase family protein [Muribaculaceae bacterium]
MKIALMTIWHEKNYGAEMQTYATVKALKMLGHNVEVINYLLGYIEKPTFKQKVVKLLNFFTQQDKKFRKFWSKYIPSGRFYVALKDLQENPPEADLYLVGSDQVWNPILTKDKAAAYFLDFGGEMVRKAAYASSFGTENWVGDSSLTELAQFRLSQMEAVSCREKSGVDILKNTFGIDAVNVLDPTLLHTDYNELTGEIQETDTLAFYPLSGFPELERYAMGIAEKLGLKYIDVNRKKYLIRNIIWDRPSVEDWIRSIAEAKFVITPSFHGLAFSLIYHRQFVVVQNPNGGPVKTRILSLLQLLGLEDRFFTDIDELKKSDILSHKIDYKTIDLKLDELRKQSFDFLRKLG